MEDSPNRCSFLPGEGLLHKKFLTGTILSGVAYGLVLILFVDSIRLLFKRSTLSQKKKWGLVAFMSLMFLGSTAALALACADVVRRTKTNAGCPSLQIMTLFVPSICMPYVCVLWEADGMMIWRCLILYDGISRPRYRALVGVLAGISLLSLGERLRIPLLPTTLISAKPIEGWGVALLIPGIFYKVGIMGESGPTSVALAILPAVTVFNNVVLASLISFRLVWHQNRTRRLLGKAYGSPYKRVISICVESCSLIIVVNIIFLALLVNLSPDALIVESLLTHTSVISALLVLHRVAKGTDATAEITTDDIPLTVGNKETHLSTLQFSSTAAFAESEYITESSMIEPHR
ncbi:hypothetical protein NLJ89_g10511 [Agrocybe chaxingu]|uniref:Uncharacterized protein n=1 Tax=Agrocybe chaxingu TaxID=84603 RepID=A0A9W8MS27_9AGAR|nr:hypothetical protein NLJ89_g10511 [Agrocybe chaxingu]